MNSLVYKTGLNTIEKNILFAFLSYFFFSNLADASNPNWLTVHLLQVQFLFLKVFCVLMGKLKLP